MDLKYSNLSFGERALMEKIVEDIEDKFNLSAEECLKYLRSLKKRSGKLIRKPKIPLPFYGKIYDDKCQAIVLNKRLYTQCKFGITEEVYCGRHAQSRKYGVISDRLDPEWKPNGPSRISYMKFVDKSNIGRNDVERVIRDLNIKEEYLNAL